MGCASTSVAGRSASVLEEAAPNTNTATTGGYMAKVHPLRRMDALDKNNCNLHSLPSTPTSDGGRTEIMDSGYHDLKRMSQMSNDSIESMVQHLVEEKPREQVITEVMSLAHELVAMEKEVAEAAVPPEEKDPPPNSIKESASEQGLEKATEEDENAEEKLLPDAETDVALVMNEMVDVEAAAEAKEEENIPTGKDEEQEKDTAIAEGDELLLNDTINQEQDEVLVAEVEELAENIAAEEENNSSSNDTEECADAAKDAEPADNAAVDEDDTSSKLHFEMSFEDVEMLEAQLRELSTPTPSPVPPAVSENVQSDGGEHLEELKTPELAATPLPEEAETAAEIIELTPVVEICSVEKVADAMNSVQECDDHNPLPPLLENSLEVAEKSEV